MLCGCSIMHNPGISVLQNLVRHVGVGRMTTASGRIGTSRMSGSMSQEDLLADDDVHSVAASSSHMTSLSGIQLRERLSKIPSGMGDRNMPGSSAASISGMSVASIQKRRHVPKPLSRESSKESSSSDEQTDKKVMYQGMQHSPGPSSVVSTPPMPTAARKITPTPKIGPNGRKMVKSYSQDASSNMAAVAASAVVSTTSSSAQNVSVSAPITTSVSDTQISQVTPATASVVGSTTAVLTSKPPLPQQSSSSSVASSISSPTTSTTTTAASAAPTKSETLSTSASTNSLRPPTVEEESYSAASDSGSVASELDSSGKKEKKKRSFFNFRKKKEKIP